MNCQEFWDHLPQRGHDITEAQPAIWRNAPPAPRNGRRTGPWRPGLHSMGEEWRKRKLRRAWKRGSWPRSVRRRATGFDTHWQRSWWTPVFGWASAAAAMVALAVVLIHGYQPAPAKPTVAAPHHTVATHGANGRLTDADSDDESAVLGEGFVRLPNAPRIEPNEDFNVVRVEVPGSAMIAMGISISEDQASRKRFWRMWRWLPTAPCARCAWCPMAARIRSTPMARIAVLSRRWSSSGGGRASAAAGARRTAQLEIRGRRSRTARSGGEKCALFGRGHHRNQHGPAGWQPYPADQHTAPLPR
jgi:hypothetical protein